MDTNSLCSSVCFSIESTRQAVRHFIQAMDEGDDLDVF